jgi:transcriptional regulator with XRE-family HTH domain
MTEQQVIDRLLEYCKKSGSQSAVADEAGVSKTYLSDVLKGRRTPGPKILGVLGLYRQPVSYKACQ